MIERAKWAPLGAAKVLWPIGRAIDLLKGWTKNASEFLMCSTRIAYVGFLILYKEL